MGSSLGEALLPYQALRHHDPGVTGFRRLRSHLYNEGQVRIWPYPRANGEHTIDVLRRLRAEIPHGRLSVIWDGAPYHRAKAVWSAAASLDITLAPLSSYSPDGSVAKCNSQWVL
jgi:transposase